jgi:hypothetical protein
MEPHEFEVPELKQENLPVDPTDGKGPCSHVWALSVSTPHTSHHGQHTA